MPSLEALRITDEQFRELDEAGLGIVEQAPHQLPELSDFRVHSHNNFRKFFWKWGDNVPSPSARGQYYCANRPVFKRYAFLYSEKLQENEMWVDAFEYVQLDTLKCAGGDGKVFTRAERDVFNDALIEPRLFAAWCIMSQLIDRHDPDYVRYVGTFYNGRATSLATSSYLGGGS